MTAIAFSVNATETGTLSEILSQSQILRDYERRCPGGRIAAEAQVTRFSASG